MPIRRRNSPKEPEAPALEAARARVRAAGLGGDPVEIEHAARAYAAALRRDGLAAAARSCAAALRAGAPLPAWLDDAPRAARRCRVLTP